MHLCKKTAIIIVVKEKDAKKKNMHNEGGARRGHGAVKILALILVLAAAAYYGYQMMESRQQKEKADKAMTHLEKVIPGLGNDTGMTGGAGRDQLAAITYDGIDIVGVIEIPSLDIMAPVAGKNVDEAWYASWLDGSPVRTQFRIIGGRKDVFRKIARLKPGDNVSFTDTEGVRYNYRVTTQYHIKKWDMGENALQICYETDSDTYFAVGCAAAE